MYLMLADTWGSATQQQVSVRAVLRVSYDSYSARRRRRTFSGVHASEPAGDIVLTILMPPTAVGPWLYAAIMLLGGAVAVLHRYVWVSTPSAFLCCGDAVTMAGSGSLPNFRIEGFLIKGTRTLYSLQLHDST